MKKILTFLPRFIFLCFIFIILSSTFLKNTNLVSRLTMIPFIICILASILQTVFLVKDNYKYVDIFRKVYAGSFLTYGIGFLIVWSILMIKENHFFSVLFTIPFWLFLVFFIRKIFGKKEISKKASNSLKQTKVISTKTTTSMVPILFVSLFLVIGLGLLFFGIKGTYELNKKSKNYQQTEAYYSDYEIYSSDRKGTTYRLIYTYTVRGFEYEIATDYGTNVIPKLGSKRTIKYNPRNPEEAFLVGGNTQMILIFMGILFTMVPLIFLGQMLSIFDKLKNLKIDVVGFIVGLVFTIMGLGMIYMMGGSFSIPQILKDYSSVYIIPIRILILFVIVGIFLMVKSIWIAFQKEGGN